MTPHPRPNIQARLDAAFTLRAMTINDLRGMATWRGLSAKGSRRRVMVRIYRDMVNLDGVIRFSCGVKVNG